MKKLLNFGVSNPLTLGMAHPIADRLETLGRARPTTWRSRALAFSAMGVLAIVSAPLTIAADASEGEKVETKFHFLSNVTDDEAQNYEIIIENGETKAYRIGEDGLREAAKLETDEDGTMRLVYSDGQVVDLPNINLAHLENLKALDGLEETLEGLDGLAGLKGLAGLQALGKLDELESLSWMDDIKMGNTGIRIVDLEESLAGSSFEEVLATLPENIREMLQPSDGSKQFKFMKNGDLSNSFVFSQGGGDIFQLEDSFVFSRNDDVFRNTQQQLAKAKRQIEVLAEDETLAFDLENALRDIESARKSIEAAESRLQDKVK